MSCIYFSLSTGLALCMTTATLVVIQWIAVVQTENRIRAQKMNPNESRFYEDRSFLTAHQLKILSAHKDCWKSVGHHWQPIKLYHISSIPQAYRFALYNITFWFLLPTSWCFILITATPQIRPKCVQSNFFRWSRKQQHILCFSQEGHPHTPRAISLHWLLVSAHIRIRALTQQCLHTWTLLPRSAIPLTHCSLPANSIWWTLHHRAKDPKQSRPAQWSHSGGTDYLRLHTQQLNSVIKQLEERKSSTTNNLISMSST